MQGNINIPDSTITTNLSFRQLVLMNMQQLTNFPYIEKDFDALTDYELLCLVVKFLNDVIANQNEQNDSITRMYESFLALQDYVNNTKDELEDAFNNLDDYVRNYFDNLDVQEEINNKLDQMLEDGVLEQIIEQFIQTNALWCFDTVADMKLATNLINGSCTKTLGFNSVNDGGMSTYKIRNKNDGETTNEKSVISLYDTNLVAELIFDKEICPEQFGAYGDGIHDDKDAIQFMFNTGFKNIVMNKTYYVSNSIILRGNNYKINGTGSIRSDSNNPVIILNVTYSEINLSGTIEGATCIKFRATETDDNYIQYVSLKNMILEATDKCIECERISEKWINELHFEGIEFNGSYGFYFMGDFANVGYRFINCGNESCTTSFIKAYNLSDIDIIGLRNGESAQYNLIDIENNCTYFNINTSDPVRLDKIILPRTTTNRGYVIANINDSGSSRIGSSARCFNGVFFLNPESTNGLRLNSTNDTYDYTTNESKLYRTCLTLDYVEGGHNYTIKIPSGYFNTTEKLLTIRNNGVANTLSLYIDNTSHNVTFGSSGTFDIINHNGLLYLSKLDSSIIS